MKLVMAAVGLVLAALATPGHAQAPLAEHKIISDENGEQRRSVNVRLDRRLDEAELLRIAEAIKARARQQPSRTYINFLLASSLATQGAWASVLFSPEPKLLVHGLKRQDEELLIAEHQSDTRPLLGAWLTSPPAAPGRLSIYSDSGRIFAEWRLRGGERTVDEVQDATSHAGRRFNVIGGGHYILARSGDLEIWDGATLIAVGERIRTQPARPAGRMALGSKPAEATAHSAPAVAAPVASQHPPSDGPSATALAITPAISAKPVRKSRSRALSSKSEPKPGSGKPTYTGDSISAKIAGTL